MTNKPKYNIDLNRGHGSINLNLKDFGVMAFTENEDKLWEIISSQRWSISFNKDDKPKYLYSNTCKKYLHQIVMDYYFEEEERKKAYKKNFVIDHLNNNGLDCRISNLSFLHNTRNIYKGNYFDKKSEQALPKFALRVFHDIKYNSFQITIGFTANANLMINKAKPIQDIKFLYKNVKFWNVIQDAETMLDELLEEGKLNLDDNPYRYIDYEITYGEYIKVTDEEANNGISPGNVIFRNGKPYIVMGDSNRIRGVT